MADYEDRESKTNIDKPNPAGPDTNPDPITGAAGSHPVGTGVGAASGAAAGAALGAIGGPVGAVIGGVAGAIAGGLTGKAVGEWNDPSEDDEYWSQNYNQRSYVRQGESYDDYRDAYQLGSQSARDYGTQDPDRHWAFSDVEDDLRQRYETSDVAANRPWENVRGAAEDAFNRTLQLREERLNVNKQRVESGEVTLRKEVVTEHRTIDVPVEREELVIERRAPGTDRDAGRIGDETAEEIRVPLSEEQVDVTKETVVREEVDVSKRKVRDTQRVAADVRREELQTDSSGKVDVRHGNSGQTGGNPGTGRGTSADSGIAADE